MFEVRKPVIITVRNVLFWRKETELYPVIQQTNSSESWIALCQDKVNAQWVADTLNEQLYRHGATSHRGAL